MKKLLLAIVILAAFVSGAGYYTKGAFITGADGTNAVTITTNGGLTVIPLGGYFATSNVGPTIITASNLQVVQVITNEVDVDITSAIPLIVSNLLKVYGGVGITNVPFINVTNTVTTALSDNKINVTNTINATLTGNLVNVTNIVNSLMKDTNGAGLEFHDGSVVASSILERKKDAGERFHACNEQSSLANGGSFIMAILITNYSLNMNAGFSAEGKGWVRLYEIAGVPTNLGTALTPYNVNRANGTNGLAVVRYFTTPSFVTNYGTQLICEFIPGGSGANSVGSSVSSETTWKFKTNSWYVFQFSNTSGSAKDVSGQLDWYREYP